MWATPVKRPCMGRRPDGGPCTALVEGRARCPAHTKTTTQRGYGSPHQSVRLALAATLPAPCGYCGVVIGIGERWDAAHRVDGHPEYGLFVAHPSCNQRAKVRK